MQIVSQWPRNSSALKTFENQMQKEALSQLHSPHLPKKQSLPKELDKNPPSKTCPKVRQYFKISNIKKRKQTKTIQKKDTVMLVNINSPV